MKSKALKPTQEELDKPSKNLQAKTNPPSNMRSHHIEVSFEAKRAAIKSIENIAKHAINRHKILNINLFLTCVPIDFFIYNKSKENTKIEKIRKNE